jgi:hypothetical protein
VAGLASTLMNQALRVAVLCLVLPAGLRGQSDGLRAGTRLWSVWAGGSWSDRLGPSYATIPTQPYAMIAARSEYVIETYGPLALSFFMEAMPAIVVGRVPHYHTVEIWTPPAGPMRQEKVWDAPGPVYGAGVSPVGLQVYFAASRDVRLFVNGSGGVAWFTRDMPVPDARQVNFSVDAGGGLRWTRGNRAILAGVKLQHMSNAYMGRQNPGLDGNLVYLGLSRAR